MNCIKVLSKGLLLLALLTVGAFAGADAGEGKGHKQPDHERTRQDQNTPKKVERFYARQQGDAIALRWQSVKGDCDGYRVYHEAGDRLLPGSYWFDVDGSQTTYLFRDVTAGGEYTFRVSALYGRKEGPPSTPVTVRMLDKKNSGFSDTAK